MNIFTAQARLAAQARQDLAHMHCIHEACSMATDGKQTGADDGQNALFLCLSVFGAFIFWREGRRRLGSPIRTA